MGMTLHCFKLLIFAQNLHNPTESLWGGGTPASRTPPYAASSRRHWAAPRRKKDAAVSSAIYGETPFPPPTAKVAWSTAPPAALVRPPRRPKWSALFSVLVVPGGLLPAAVRVRLVCAAVVPARPAVDQGSLAACREEQGEGGRAAAAAAAREEGESE